MDSQLAYQQAFLQNAVAQNMQIQQQLMMQNQALNQMLSQTSTVRNASSPEKSSMSPRPDTSPNRAQPASSGPQKPVPVYFGMTEAHRRASESQLSAGPPQELYEASKHMSKTAPNTPRHSTNIPPQAPTLSALDAYGRAKTVRIGSQDKPWMNAELKKIHRQRNREYCKRGKSLKYKSLNKLFETKNETLMIFLELQNAIDRKKEYE